MEVSQDHWLKVYSKPLHTNPIYLLNSKPIYSKQELNQLYKGVEGQEKIDWMIEQLGDVVLSTEV